MADEEYDNEGHAAEEEWTETVDVDELLDGPTTLFVGGFSKKYKTVNDALDGVQTSNDRIVVLTPMDGDVVIDTTRFNGVHILGATPRNTLVIKTVSGSGGDDELEGGGAGGEDEEDLDEEELLRRRTAREAKVNTTLSNICVSGRLVLQHSAPTPHNKLPTGYPEVEEDDEHGGGNGGNGAADDEDEDGDGNNGGGDGGDGGDGDGSGGSGLAPRETRLVVNGLNFTNGAEFEAQTTAYVEDCAFGTEAFQPEIDVGVRLHAFSTAELLRCQLYGSHKAACYCYPHSRAVLRDCDFRGAVPQAIQAQRDAEAQAKKPRGYVPPPPAPKAVPALVACAVGIYGDDTDVKVVNADITNVNIGVYSIGTPPPPMASTSAPDGGAANGSPGTASTPPPGGKNNNNKNNKTDPLTLHGLQLTKSRISQVATVGALFEHCCAKGGLQECVLTLCGRECLVVGPGHPTIRGNTFVGDVRLKAQAEATGITDNIVALNHQVILEENRFIVKGFTQISTDPTIPKEKKKKEDDF